MVEVAYDEQYDEENDDVYSWYLLYKSKKDRMTITSTPLTSRSILTEFSRLDGAYRCPLHQKSGEWPDNPCPVCASNALKLDLSPLELDVEAAARSREKTRALLDSIELTPAQKKMAEAGAQYLKDRMKEGEE